MIIWGRGTHGATSITFNANCRERPLLCSLGGREVQSPTSHDPASVCPTATALVSHIPSMETGLSLSASPARAFPPQSARLPLKASPEVCLPSSISMSSGLPKRASLLCGPSALADGKLPYRGLATPSPWWEWRGVPPLSFSVLRSPQLSLK